MLYETLHFVRSGIIFFTTSSKYLYETLLFACSCINFSLLLQNIYKDIFITITINPFTIMNLL
jgi:hypothetical protein